MQKNALLEYLNSYLELEKYSDDSKNGLQVDSSKKEIKKIGYAVDATKYIFEKAVQEKVDFLLVHHGLYWGREDVIVGLHFERIKVLMEADIALYGVHLPLDAHSVVGNNIELVRAWIKFFGIEGEELEKFGSYHGKTIGYGIRWESPVLWEQVKDFCVQEHLDYQGYNFGNKEEIYSVSFVSGGGWDALEEGKDGNFDMHFTGEVAHQHLTRAKDIGQSLVVAGHYETEVYGVRSLAEHLKDKFEVKVVFLDEKY